MERFREDDFVNTIRAKADIVKIISEYMNLKRTGENFKGLCPFHAEKTPSFIISPQKGIFHCFGCGAGGDIFTFVMKHDHLSFPDAVNFLAEKMGIPIPQKKEEFGKRISKEEKEVLIEINSIAMDFFRKNLIETKGGERARNYLIKRGLSQVMIEKFAIGCAPSSWDEFTNYAISKGIEEENLVKSGLIVAREKGSGYYDRFRDRIIFPIFDLQGRVIAFGGRVIDKGEPKYLNSPETAIYVKGQALYALNYAKTSIRSFNKVLVVEGYLDLITAFQYGFENTVAILGTAFTPAQAYLLKRYTDEIITCFDADTAGEAATFRGMEFLIESGMRVKVARLPVNTDPDSFIRSNGREAFEEVVNASRDIIIEIAEKFSQQFDTSRMDGKIRAANAILPLIRSIQNSLEQRLYVRNISEKFGFDENFILEEIRGSRKEKKNSRAKAVDSDKTYPYPLERNLLKIIIQKKGLFMKLLEELKAGDFFHLPYRDIFIRLSNIRKEKQDIDSIYSISSDSENASSIISQLFFEECPLGDINEFIMASIKKIKEMRIRRSMKDLKVKIMEAEAKKLTEEVKELLFSQQEMIKNLENLNIKP